MKTALVLSGGGARGLAHLGVMKAFEKAGIKIDMIVGCSFGAIIGALYAQTPDSVKVEKHMHKFMHDRAFKELGLDYLKKSTVTSDDTLRQLANSIKDWVLLNVVAKRMALFKAERLENAINFLLRDENIEDCRLPFACNATDLVTGRPYLFTEGSIRKAVTASATIPGYFPPVRHADKLLVDGAVSYNLPVRLAREMGADFVIAVDVHPFIHPENNFKNVLDVILRVKSITSNILTDETMNAADVLIIPPVKEYFWYEFDRFVEIIQAGKQAARLRFKEIEQKMQPQGLQRVKRMFRSTAD